MTQKFNVNDSTNSDLISATGTAYGVEVSKKLLFITLYGGFQIEKGSFTINTFTSKIGETSVTGSAHCCLGPYWKARLKKSEFTVYQASQRGGLLRVRVGDRRVTSQEKR